jgi:Ubiquitin carboxyl-terminal hydrolase
MDLDMESYSTRRARSRKRDIKTRSYYSYKLRGIVIHTGTAESGHYYSYIGNNDQ